MANTYTRTRTNYFRITDLELLTEIIGKCKTGNGDEIYISSRKKDGETLYSFSCQSSIDGYYDEEKEESSFDAFTEDLKKVVMKGDSIIIYEIGHEALRYLFGFAFIITSDKIESMDFSHLILEKAAELVGNPKYQIILEY